jgi:lipopolysaccharide transport system permease protein
MNKLISAKPDSLKTYLNTVWTYRFMLFILAKRDLKIKYAQTFIGISWTLVYPITSLIIFTTFFHFILRINATYPYPLFVLSGVLNWGIFSYIFNQAAPSLLNHSDIVKKTQFPKIIIPLSKCIIALVEFAVSFIVFILLLIIFKTNFSWLWFAFPLALIPVLLFAIGISLILSAVTVKKRDLFHIIPFIVNFSIWFTPVFYPVNILPAKFHSFLYINPITSSIHLFRYIFFNETFNPFFYIGLVLAILFFVAGILAFKSVEEKINDSI